MPRPNGDNKLTKDLLRLRDTTEESLPGKIDPVFSISVSLKGPNFEFIATAKGEPWIVRKLLQDLDASIEQVW